MNDSLPHTVVLDTHAWLWMGAADSRIRKPKVLEAIEWARSRGGAVVSAISVWEVALLESKQRMVLHQDCHLWVRTALAAPGIILQPLSPEIAVESTRLPGDFHGDPADRILVATSRVLNAPLVTADTRILAYGSHKHVRTLPV